MSFGGVLASLFPLCYLAGAIAGLTALLLWPTWWGPMVWLLALYLVPLVLFRLHGLFFQIEEGDLDLSLKRYSPWWTGHMLQLPFIAVPLMESLLHFVPGLYSAWLRAWGAKVGRRVYWTPRTEILDRNLIEIGDDVLIGHMSIMVSHMVESRDGRPVLILRKIRIGSKAFVGADAQLGPGAEIAPGAKLKPKVRLWWKGAWN